MKIVMTGATGFIGHALCAELLFHGHAVVALVRNIESAKRTLPASIEFHHWDATGSEFPDQALRGADAVIHLAGEPVAQGRWTEERKARIRSSRVDSTARLVEAIRRSEAKPKILICASAVGIYGSRRNESLDEGSGPGTDFLAQVCVDWEKASMAVDALGVRRVNVRTGVVLGRGGGALESLLPVFKSFVGGPIGSGKQWMSWIHLSDMLAIYLRTLEDAEIHGPLNATAPDPVTNESFSRKLAKALNRPAWVKTPGFVLKLAFGEMAGMLLGGQKVIPKKLLDRGFQFKYPDLDLALKNLTSSSA